MPKPDMPSGPAGPSKDLSSTDEPVEYDHIDAFIAGLSPAEQDYLRRAVDAMNDIDDEGEEIPLQPEEEE